MVLYNSTLYILYADYNNLPFDTILKFETSNSKLIYNM